MKLDFIVLKQNLSDLTSVQSMLTVHALQKLAKD